LSVIIRAPESSKSKGICKSRWSYSGGACEERVTRPPRFARFAIGAALCSEEIPRFDESTEEDEDEEANVNRAADAIADDDEEEDEAEDENGAASSSSTST
jgi:hypothetical protein